jgi:hypothetical protein
MRENTRSLRVLTFLHHPQLYKQLVTLLLFRVRVGISWRLLGCKHHCLRLCYHEQALILLQSGVSYGLLGRTDYNANQNNYMRTSQAYSVRVSRDNSWVPDGRDQDFHFQACSGTRWEQIIDEPHQGYIQLDNIAMNTDMVLLQAGGDNANLTAVAYACIFAPEGQEWGPAYPDPSGKCYQDIERVFQYIHGRSEHELFEDTRRVVDAIFQHNKTKDNSDFRLFVSGYSQLFYDEGGVGEWCDTASFALRLSDRPTLSLALRKKINELIRALNNGIKAGIAASSYHDRVQFIDVDSQFADHRFCQPGQSLYDQYFGDSVYLWNMSPGGVIVDAGGATAGGDSNTKYAVREPTREEFDRWVKTGAFTNDPSELHLNMSAVANTGLTDDNASGTGKDPQWLNMIDPFPNQAPGIALRPFHPKQKGYEAIAQVVAKTFRESYAEKPLVNAPALATEPEWKHSIQILLREHQGYFSWFMYKGPSQLAVNPCFDYFFERVVTNQRDTRKGLSLMYPPYVGYGANWGVEIEHWSDDGTICRYQSAQDDPGHLICGDFFDYPLTKDYGYDGKNIRCSQNSRWDDGTFHRAWVVEYQVWGGSVGVWLSQ